MKKKGMSVKFITQAAVIAAIYVVLVVIFNYISFGPVQFRIAEALTILPYFTPAAIPGLFVGCIIANILGGAIVWDVVFGSIATLIGAIGTYLLRKHKWLAPVPPIVANTISLYHSYLSLLTAQRACLQCSSLQLALAR
jgi:uncharacterized membrane protein